MNSAGEERCFLLTLAYDGTDYHGWQRQSELPTIQGELERALARLLGEHVPVRGAGRTDAGVHAAGQVAGFSARTPLPVDAFRRGLNAYLPGDIRVLAAKELPRPFRPTGDATGKRYRYTFDDGATHDVFTRRYRWHVYRRLDAERMHAAAQSLLGRHDFRSLENAGSPRQDSVRTLRELTVARGQGGDQQRVDLEIVGDGFLYNMVRNIAGSLYKIGHGAEEASWLAAALAARDRAAAGPTAPPQGLTLVEVFYDAPALAADRTAPGQAGTSA